MNTRGMVAMASALGLLATVCAGGETQQAPPLAFELTIDGQTFEIQDSTPVEITVQGKRVEASIRIKPIQHYAIDGLEFDYGKSLALHDDFDQKGRTINLTRGSAVSIVVTDFGPSDANGPKATLVDIAGEMESRIKRGVCKDLRKTFPVPISFKRSRGYTTSLTYKDEDDEEQVCRMYALESKGRRFSVIVQYDMAEKELSESLARITLDSISGR